MNIRILQEEALVENSASMGSYMLDRLTSLKEHPIIGDVRGLGLLCALDLVKDKTTKEPLGNIQGVEAKLAKRLADNGLLTRAKGFLFLTPPLTVTRSEVDEMVDIVADGISYIERELGY